MSASRKRPSTYTSAQKLLHWLVAAIVLLMVPTGLYMVKRYVATSFDAVTRQIFDVHKLVGIITLGLVLVRLFLRFRHGAPPLPASLSGTRRRLATAAQATLYVLLLLVPMLGWLGASADGTRSMAGGLMLPEIIAHDDDLGWRILWWHGWAAIGLAALAIAHAAAGLQHLVVFKDGVFERMWPTRRGR